MAPTVTAWPTFGGMVRNVCPWLGVNKFFIRTIYDLLQEHGVCSVVSCKLDPVLICTKLFLAYIP
jgi:hypothetical protein